MSTFIDFINHHSLLTIIFMILLIAFLINEWYLRNIGTPSVSPQLLVNWMNHSDTKVIDIRHLSAYQEGHILNSTHIPMPQLTTKLNTLKKYQDKPIVVVCTSGQSAVQAVTTLQKQGFKQVYILNGGLNSWKSAGLPLEKRT